MPAKYVPHNTGKCCIIQGYKLKGKIDQSGNLLITETVNLPPGNVEIVV
ncbi:hypothetical protein PN480_13280 [Dolichospermum circinale CS-1225]|nr:hypothetical protein [Dolichospermum circinale CS-1225]